MEPSNKIRQGSGVVDVPLAAAARAEEEFNVDFKAVSTAGGKQQLSENDYTSIPCILTQTIIFKC